MPVDDVSGPTLGFNAPSSKFERRLILFRTRVASASKQRWPRLRGPIGLAVFAFVIFKTWPPSLANTGLAVSSALLWFTATWLLSNRYRLRSIDVPDSLKKSGISGASLTREISSSARELLRSVQMDGVPVPIELPPASQK
jgi:hypothetical protein